MDATRDGAWDRGRSPGHDSRDTGGRAEVGLEVRRGRRGGDWDWDSGWDWGWDWDWDGDWERDSG